MQLVFQRFFRSWACEVEVSFFLIPFLSLFVILDAFLFDFPAKKMCLLVKIWLLSQKLRNNKPGIP